MGETFKGWNNLSLGGFEASLSQGIFIKKRHLAILLSRLKPNPKPRLRWEAYTIDAESAAEIAYAAFLNGDIEGKKVVDLGCGSGILGISASLLGARMVLGIDIDKSAVKTAVLNAEMVNTKIELVVGDIECIVEEFDTTLMNPPFGTWRRGADVRFLRKALQISNVVYSLHKRSNKVRRFLEEKIPKMMGRIDWKKEIELVIGRVYPFHRKKRYHVPVDLYRITRVEEEK